MSTVVNRRIRGIAPAPRSPWERAWKSLSARDSRIRTAAALLAAFAMYLGTNGWAPPFPFRSGQTPDRDLVARVNFSVLDEVATRNARYEARRQSLCVYLNRTQPLEEMKQKLIDQVLLVKSSLELDSKTLEIWNAFLPASAETSVDTSADNSSDASTEEVNAAFLVDYERFKEALSSDSNLSKVKRAIDIAFIDFDKYGLLRTLEHDIDDGPLTELRIVRDDSSRASERVNTSNVRIDEIGDDLEPKLLTAFATEFEPDAAQVLSRHLFAWIRPSLPTTLTFDRQLTEAAEQEAERDVLDVQRNFEPGDSLEWRLTDSTQPDRIRGGQPLGEDDLALLQAEHSAFVADMGAFDRMLYSFANLGMFSAMFLLCGAYLFYREPQLFADVPRVIGLVLMYTITVLAVYVVSRDNWRGELIPVLLFTMIVSIAYRHELALMLAAAIALVCSFTTGQGLPALVVLFGTSATASFLCGAIRSRTRLVWVGLAAAAIAMPTTLGVYLLSGQPMMIELPDGGIAPNTALIRMSLWYGVSAILGAFMMAALLPFIEKTFGIETDMRLLELGIPSHPLLQSLILRAPGTYNHSINVASLAEEAAKQIGANSLLCRVGAYFHDIGKMCKPEYFVENQTEGNKHQSLNPQMSTLIILSHVKDGVELAREHRLPKRIIDFIEQHHGTTLVEYFFEQARRQQAESGQSGEVNPGSFRYPGPKPQSKETAVLMLSDACESASRTLVDPTPARIENLVREISRKKLYDGQFDECSLTLRELRLIENSLIKTINAMFHARVRYPEPSSS